ncbi:hypothetical protein [Marinomonas sp. 2405UD68-3]|uniref:hypothetical protein n=1 Tax=Marinomonas sp. 2405UD68-3 TaxID=3391835 RepID=UPI0039C9A181
MLRLFARKRYDRLHLGLTYNPDLIEANAHLESFINSMSNPNVLAEMGYGVIKTVSDLKKYQMNS